MVNIPLCYAVGASHYDAVKLLIEHGANVNIRVIDRCPRDREIINNMELSECATHTVSLLHIAVCLDATSIVELLLLNGANQGTCCTNGSCAHIAILNGNKDILRLLYYYSVDIMEPVDRPYEDCYECYVSERYESIDDVELALSYDNADIIAIIASYQDQSMLDRMLTIAYDKERCLDVIRKLVDMGAAASSLSTSIEHKYKYYKSLYDLVT